MEAVIKLNRIAKSVSPETRLDQKVGQLVKLAIEITRMRKNMTTTARTLTMTSRKALSLEKPCLRVEPLLIFQFLFNHGGKASGKLVLSANAGIRCELFGFTLGNLIAIFAENSLTIL